MNLNTLVNLLSTNVTNADGNLGDSLLVRMNANASI